METIRLETWINAPVERCFQLSLSVDLHVASAAYARERAIEGVTSGMIRQGDSVTFEGRHFGHRRQYTTKLELLRTNSFIRMVMTKSSFRHFEHDRHFAAMDDGTRIRDEVGYVVPWSFLGSLISRLYLRERLARMFSERNAFLKRVAESNDWRGYLDDHRREVTQTITVKKPAVSEWRKGILRESQG